MSLAEQVLRNLLVSSPRGWISQPHPSTLYFNAYTVCLPYKVLSYLPTSGEHVFLTVLTRLSVQCLTQDFLRVLDDNRVLGS